MHAFFQWWCCWDLDPHKKSFLRVYHHPGVKGTCVFPSHTEIPHYTPAQGQATPFPLPPVTVFLKIFSSLEAKVSTRTVDKESLEGGQATSTQLERTVLSLTWWSCAQGHAQKGFSWTLANTSKENTSIHPLNTLAVLALLHVWTLLLARAAL